MNLQDYPCGNPRIDDVLLEDGAYVKYEYQNDSIYLKWGKSDFLFPERLVYHCKTAPVRIPQFKWSTSEFIVVGYGCGSPCWGMKVLPLSPEKSIQDYMYQVAFEKAKGIIVYIAYQNDGLTAVNLFTGKKENIKLGEICGQTFPGYCIDSVSINNSELFVRWKDEYESDEMNEMVLKLKL